MSVWNQKWLICTGPFARISHQVTVFITKEVAFRIEMLQLSQLGVTLNGLRVKRLITIYVTLHS